MARDVDYATVQRVNWPLVTITINPAGGGTGGSYTCHTLEDGYVDDGAPGVRQLAPGDQVLVAYIAGDVDRPVVLGRIAT